MSKPIDEVLACLKNVKTTKGGWTARCPAHDDKKNSLSLKEGDDQRVLVKCHAGCSFREIVDASSMAMDNFFPPKPPAKKKRPRSKKKSEIVSTYDYTDEKGNLLFQVCRTTDKQFPQRRPDGKDGWLWGLGDVKPVLYRLPQILSAIQDGQSLYIVEGEKDVERLVALRLSATTSPMGAGKWRDNYTQTLQGCKDVVLLPDNDLPGQTHAERIAAELYEIGVRVTILQLPNLPQGGDVSDWLDAGGSIAELQGLLENTALWAPSSSSTPQKRTISFNLTDYGNAERLVALHGKDMHYCYPWESWLVWDGCRWHRDASGEVLRLAKETARSIYGEARVEADETRRQAIAKHAVRSEGSARINAMIYLAQSEPSIPVQPDELDTKPWLLDVQNGTLDLRSGELLSHNRSRLCTRLAPVRYERSASCPTWEQFLVDVMAGNQALIAFLQRAIGYAFTGLIREHALFFLYGTGRNGKTTFLEIIQSLLGDYSEAAEFTSFLIRKNDNNVRNDLAKLKGARFVSSIETKEGSRLDVATVKQLTGGDTITARFLYGEFFNFRPVFKLWMAANHKPVIRDTTDSTWDRVKLIPFQVKFNQPDLQLPEKLKAELSGILNWAVRGCLEWQQHGLGEPSEVTEATRKYREEMDPLARFLKKCCVLHPRAEATAKDLYENYKIWCEQNGEPTISQRAFGSRLTERGLKNKRQTSGSNKGRKQWFGVELATSE